MTDPLPLEARRQESPRAGPRSWWRYPQLLIFSLCVAVAVAVAVPVAVGVASIALWAQSGAFWPEPIPPLVQYLGGDYQCMGLPAPDTNAGLTLQGHTVGGGRIYARPPIDSKASAGWILVTDGHRRQACIYIGPN
jgi:hypothetical protein